MLKVSLVLGLTLFGPLRLAGYFTGPILNGPDIHRIDGESDRLTRAAIQSRDLSVVTWNLERGVEFDRILATLKAVDADIVLLQEVDRFCRRSGWRDVASDLAAGLAMNWMFAGEFQEIGESKNGIPAITGQVILSKYPIADTAVLPFKNQARLRWRWNPVQPRRGARMALRARTAGILVYNAHLESGGNDPLGRKQVDEILAEQARNIRATEPVIIAGDFNNVPAIRSAMFGRLSAAHFSDALQGDSLRRRTSLSHAHAIDWIFVRNLQPYGGHVKPVAHASDHYPVLATVSR